MLLDVVFFIGAFGNWWTQESMPGEKHSLSTLTQMFDSHLFYFGIVVHKYLGKFLQFQLINNKETELEFYNFRSSYICVVGFNMIFGTVGFYCVWFIDAPVDLKKKGFIKSIHLYFLFNSASIQCNKILMKKKIYLV